MRMSFRNFNLELLKGFRVLQTAYVFNTALDHITSLLKDCCVVRTRTLYAGTTVKF